MSVNCETTRSPGLLTLMGLSAVSSLYSPRMQNQYPRVGAIIKIVLTGREQINNSAPVKLYVEFRISLHRRSWHVCHHYRFSTLPTLPIRDPIARGSA
ncbi:uncharacterized protein BT62DRAFT_1008099 [Guyanagaster necrorhizus]|uniref:Uncharacterized protein n=1 Tax=Guyanagaster necrorhizus TaxID=856835 RepID=A0A9P7VNG8_9AGAR|nr:uncharacterized protein BT62DRAFT_1008099 [Guyanagaster necrorhizus MCA 3950]KAG7444436.1 hypothetical protein BT62DRAFT_1008099 [Guyanagaster necrorhizus MCA 3950]